MPAASSRREPASAIPVEPLPPRVSLRGMPETAGRDLDVLELRAFGYGATLCAWTFPMRAGFQAPLWHLPQKDAPGRTRPAALAFAGSFITASVRYSLPAPWQLSQSSGGVRRACFDAAHDSCCTLWQSLHFSAPTRSSPSFVGGTAIAPPGSTTPLMPSAEGDGAGFALSTEGVAAAGGGGDTCPP